MSSARDEASRRAESGSRWFYGWTIVAVASLTLFVTFGVRLSFSVFFVALVEEFGWARVNTIFPGDAMGAVNGSVGSAFGLGAAVIPWLAGFIFDRSGSYDLAFELAAVATIISLLALWLASREAQQGGVGASS